MALACACMQPAACRLHILPCICMHAGLAYSGKGGEPALPRGRIVTLCYGVMQTFVFDKEGVCVLVFNSQMQPEKHIQEALAVIKTL